MTYAFRKITWARASWRLTACVLLFSFMSLCADQANAQPPSRRGGLDAAPPQEGQWGPGAPAPQGAPGGDQNPMQPQDQKQDDKGKKQEEKVVDLEKALKSGGQTTPIVLNQNDFRTSDGKKLQGTYYKGKADKDTPVVIVLPSLTETQENYADLCKALATAGYAVLCVDLRGRGKSEGSNFNMGLRNNNPPNDAKKEQKPDLSVVSNDDVYAMIDIDRQLWFNFLVYLHDRGMCNMKKTIIVGSEFSSALACAWAKNDWSGRGEGYQNVVGLVLFSPDAVEAKRSRSKKADEDVDEKPKYDCLKSMEALRKLAKGKLFGAVIFVGGFNKEKLGSATLLQEKVGGKQEAELKPHEKTVMCFNFNTDRQGSELTKLQTFNVIPTVVQFVDKRMKELPTKRNKWEAIFEDYTEEE
ncbi:MAG: alpha/beta hydrolase family protein [Thermoguttaceae bacterium]|nr:alpha/beta hydrolase [Thermoguttaceae bacterium]